MVNSTQRLLFVKRVLKYFRNNVKNKRFVIWGLSFKPGTDDVREAPSIDIIQFLLKNGATIDAYDPVATLRHLIKHKKYNEIQSPVSTIKNCDGLIICTEWKEFWSIDISHFMLMKNKVIFDGRNIYNLSKFDDTGIDYIGIGRQNT